LARGGRHGGAGRARGRLPAARRAHPARHGRGRRRQPHRRRRLRDRGPAGPGAGGELMRPETTTPMETAAPDLIHTSAAAGRSGRRSVRIAAATLALLGLAVIVVPLVARVDERLVDLGSALLPPSPAHPFGTDEMGRDVLLRSVYGLRVSLLVGLVAAAVSVVIGGLVGVIAGAAGGIVDRLLMRVVDGVNSLPHLLLGIFIVALFAP